MYAVFWFLSGWTHAFRPSDHPLSPCPGSRTGILPVDPSGPGLPGAGTVAARLLHPFLRRIPRGGSFLFLKNFPGQFTASPLVPVFYFARKVIRALVRS